MEARSHQYPPVLDPARVGTYPALTNSGGGFVWDAVLEYRVWCHGPAAGHGYFRAFSSYDKALAFAEETPEAEEPLALVLQREYLDEPEVGNYIHRREERITEWPVEFLTRPARRADTIPSFLASGDPHRLDRLRGLF